MSYRIYRTDAFVLRSRPHAEADRMFTLYTDDFGLLYARASGVRLERSKLRYALSDYSHVHVALVRGKAGWRLVGAIGGTPAMPHKKHLIAFARIASLVVRLVQGEDRNEYLFGTLGAARHSLEAGEDPELIEIVSVSRILHALGYVAPRPIDEHVFAEQAYESVSLERSRAALPQLIQRINHTLSATQL